MSQGRDEPAIVRRPRRIAAAALWIVSCLLHALFLWMASWFMDVRPAGSVGGGAGVGVMQADFLGGADGEGNLVDRADREVPDTGIVQISAVAPDDTAAGSDPSDFDADEDATQSRRELHASARRPNNKMRPAGLTDAAGEPAEDLSILFDPPDADGLAGPGGNVSMKASRTQNTFLQQAPSARGRAGGKGRGALSGTSFFGLRGEGRRFVYVIDRSSSMSRLNALNSGIDEVLASLEQLPATVQIQVIFYNEHPHLYESLDRRPALVRNTPRERKRIELFARGFAPDGGTGHFQALSRAFQFEPDVVFLLSDAGEPRLTAAEIRELRQINRSRAQVHVIEFGAGPLVEFDAWLPRLSETTGGGYGYCDLQELPTSDSP